MPNLNMVFLMGHLGQDPELKHTPAGKAICTFSLATSERYKGGEEWKSDTSWHRIVAWGDVGERAAERLTKGAAVFIQGKLKYRTWEDKEGLKRTNPEIVAFSIQSIGKIDTDDRQHQSRPKPKPAAKDDYYPPPPEDEIPF